MTTVSDFWKEIVYDENGNLSEDLVAKELADYELILDEVPKVYCAVTNDRMSKPTYYAREVITMFESLHYDKEITRCDVKDMIKDASDIGELKDLLIRYFDLREDAE